MKGRVTMAKIKYKYYVRVILSKTEERFVTGTEKSFALWEKGKAAKEFSKATAEDLIFGLILNGYAAYIVQTIEGSLKDSCFTND